MDTFDAINQRRSVQAFDTGRRSTPAEETEFLEAAIQSPALSEAVMQNLFA